MISLKSFITAIHNALISASDTLMNTNVELLDKYFIESPGATTDVASVQPVDKKNLVPRTVTLEYPHMTAAGQLETLEVAVPLITLVPLTMAHVEKAKFMASFEMEVVDGELQLNFSNKKNGGFFGKKPKIGKLEITFSQQETPEGLRLLIEGYEALLKRQIA